MSNPTITYASLPDTTPEAELSALSAVYKFILDCHAKKDAVAMTSSNGDDAKGSVNDRAKASIPETY